MAVSYVNRERRKNTGLVTLEEIEQTASSVDRELDIDQQRALQQLSEFIRQLGLLDRQIMICHLEDMDAATIMRRLRGFRRERRNENLPHQEYSFQPVS